MRTKSDVWKHFVKQGKSSASCKLCNIRVETSSNTSNLWSHLSSRHGIKKTTSNGATKPASNLRQSNSDDNPDDPVRIDSEDSASGSATADLAAVTPTPSTPDSRAEGTATSLPSLQSLLGKRRCSTTHTDASPALKQVTLQSSYEKIGSFKEGGSRDAELRDALLYMMMKENLPLSFTSSEGFRYFVSKAIPLWTTPSRPTMTRQMETKHQTASELIKSAFSDLSSICLTADTWTDSHTTKSYLGMTTHFLVGTTIESACIGLMKLEQSHTGLYLGEKMLEFCNSWGITTEIVKMVTVDNAENIKLGVKSAFGENKLLNCFDHTLNLIPKYALGVKSANDPTPHVPGVPELIKKLKDIVTFSHTSSNFANELLRVQIEQFGKTEGTALRLLQDVITRWGSTFITIKRALELMEVLYLVTAKFPEVNMLTAAEFVSLRGIMEVLENFHAATVEMGAEKYTTASKVIPVVTLISKNLEEVPDEPDIARRFRGFCKGELKRRFQHAEFNIPLAVATMLDPRFIKAYFRSPQAVANTISFIEGEVKKTMYADSRQVSNTVQEISNSGDVTVAAANSSGTRKGLWTSHNDMVRSVNVAVATDDIPARARAEIRAFVSRELMPIEVDPIQAWEKIKPLYPNLYRVARGYLSIVVTSVPSERLFSKVGFISTDETSRLTAEHLSQRVFLGSLKKELWEAASIPK